MRLFLFAILFFLFSFWSPLAAQKEGAAESKKEIFPTQDTSLIQNDTIQIDTTIAPTDTIISNVRQVKISKDSLDAPVEYNAKDSMRYDIKNEKIYLYGEAVVTQNTLKLTAEYIIVDLASNIVIAESTRDSSGNEIGKPQFEEGDQSFSAGKMKYDFKNRKGVIYDVASQEGDIYIHGSQGKVIEGEYIDKDGNPNDVVYNKDAIFTTCDHPEPHFGIHAQKLKMVPGKMAVVGPSNLELGGIPTPLVLPFGFFPLQQGERTGLIFPRDYEFSQEWGFGLREVGWYFPISDSWDAKVTGDYYLKGTWGLRLNARYNHRYKNNGSFSIAFSDRKRELSDASINAERSLSLQWSHSQARAAHPTRTFSSSVNIQTNGFQSRNFNDADNVLNNSLSSNINLTQIFPGKPFNLALSMNHSQNTRSNEVTFNLPTVNFRMNRINPFKIKERTGKEKWFERITLKYDMSAQNRFTTTDTTLFSKETLESAQYGMKHDVASDISFKLFKYINVSPSVTYKEVWYGNENLRAFNNELTIDTMEILNPDGSFFGYEYDTTSYGQLEDMKINGFSRYFQFNASVTMNTRLYATKRWSKGYLRGLRHVLSPSVSLVFTPDYTNPEFGYFKEAITPVTPLNTEADTVLYSIFQGGIFGGPSQGGRQMALTYGFTNNFEAKYFSRKDSTEKNIKIFENLRFGGNYNFAADSLKFSPLSMSGNTRLFKGMTTLNINASWDPYAATVNGSRFQRRNEFYWDTDGKALRFVGASLRMNTNLTIGKIREMITGIGKSEEETEVSDSNSDAARGGGGRGGNAGAAARKKDDFISLFENFRVSHNFNMTLQPSTTTFKDTLVVSSHTVELRGKINLTENWNITVGRIGYNFTEKRVTFPDFSFYRDLHCWEMGMSWRPDRGTYSFFLRVKPGSLDFIELPYQKNNQDSFGGFR